MIKNKLYPYPNDILFNDMLKIVAELNRVMKIKQTHIEYTLFHHDACTSAWVCLRKEFLKDYPQPNEVEDRNLRIQEAQKYLLEKLNKE